MPDFLKLARAVRKAPKAGNALEDMVTTLGGLPRAGVQDILPTAQREANLASFLEPSKEKRTMYHGTARDVKAFKPKQANSVFVSPDPEFADRFADMSKYWMINHKNASEVFTPEQLKKVYKDTEDLIRANVKNPTVADYQVKQLHSGDFQTNGNIVEWFERSAKNNLPSSSNIMPVHVQVKNPFDYENPAHMKALRDYDEANKYTPKSASHFMDEVAQGDWASIETSDIQNALKELGHDAFYAKEFGQKNLGIYDPKKVKSAIGNKGTYDTTKADINEARGGQVHMQVGGLTRFLSGAAKVVPAAERELNLAKFLEPSKVQQRLYHGTTATEGGKGTEAIRRLKPSKEGALGSGVYLTPNTAHASGYTGIPNDEAIESMLVNPAYQTTALKALNQRNSGNILPAQEGGNMLPVHAQLKNPLIIEGTHSDPMIEALTKLGMDEEKAARMVEKAYEDKGYIGKQVQSRAQAQGYDGLMQYRNGDLSEVVAYNPNAVKSAIGNEGTYDIYNPDLSKAEGGDVHMQVGGLTALQKLGKAGTKLSSQRNVVRAADEAMEANRLAMEALNPPIKASEAYGKYEGAYLKPIFYDRMKVDLSQGKLGGPGFSSIQLVDPNYANAKAVAGVTDQKMATRILNRNKQAPAGAQVIWTPSVGGLEQHKSNSTMFGQFADIFANQRKNMSAEEIQKLSDRASTMLDNNGKLIFPNGIDLGSRNFRQKVNTYDQRALMADILAGRGVGGEKGRTVPVEELLEKNLDPNMANAGTLDLGNRLFTLEGNVIDRPDLHSDYRKILTGEDLKVNYLPVPIRDVYGEWETQKALDLAAQGKKRGVTMMDYTKNDPTVQLTEELLTKMQKAGHKKGGAVGNRHKDFHLKMKDGGYTWTTKDSPHVKHFDKGGLSAKDLSSGPSTVAPQLFGDTIDYLSDKLKKQLGEDISVLSTPKGAKDVALRAASFPIGAMGDLASLADLVQTKIPGLYDEKKGSVLDPDKAPSAPYRDNREEPIRTPKLPVSAIVTSPNSEDIRESFKQAGFLGDKEAPIAELALALLGPGAATKAIKAAPKVARAAESGLNTATSAVNRPFTPATFTVEATAPDLGQGTSYGFRQGLNDRLLSEPKLGTKKPTAREGQGTYVNTKGELELNPLQAIDVPRAGNIGEGAKANTALRQQVAQMGTDLNQEAMAGHRFLPMMTNNIKDASSMLIKTKEGLSKEQIADLARALGNDMVVTHNPKLGGVVVYPFGPVTKGQIPEEFLTAQSAANKLLGKDAKIKFGKSDYAKDRLYMGKDEYAKAGASPMSSEQQALREKIQGIEKFMFPESVSGIPGSVKASPIGGLQPWSRGAEYPTSVIGIGNGSKVEYQPVNFLTDAKGKRYPTYREAEQERSKMLEGWHRTLPSRVR